MRFFSAVSFEIGRRRGYICKVYYKSGLLLPFHYYLSYMVPILFLHGALGSSKMLRPFAQSFSDNYSVYLPDFEGHGGTPYIHSNFSIEGFAQQILDFLEREKIEQIDIFGYSMGGYVGLYLAKHYPFAVKSVFTLATKFDWTTETAEKESKMLNPHKIKEKVPAFANELEQRHAPNDWETLMVKTACLLISLGNNPVLPMEALRDISCPVTVSVGDRDNMVSVEETKTAFLHLPKGRLLVLPNTPHPLEKAKDNRIYFELNSFLEQNHHS